MLGSSPSAYPRQATCSTNRQPAALTVCTRKTLPVFLCSLYRRARHAHTLHLGRELPESSSHV